jgi:hypothetical protein
VRAPGRIGLLAFVAREQIGPEQPEGNNFPSPDGLSELIDRAGLRIDAWRSTADLPAIPPEWTERVDAVTDALAERYGASRTWQLAQRQSDQIGDLLAAGALTGEMLLLRRA